MGQIRPSYLVCDGTVPRTKLPEVLAKVGELSKEFDLPIGNVFHAGDGNLHPLILFDERDEEQKQRTLAASTTILKACADVGGTVSGEHGVGLEKLKEVTFIFGKEDIQFLKKLKLTFDPTNIINPDKMIPAV
jgi:glycolate oxidase